MIAALFAASVGTQAWIDAAYPLSSRFRNTFDVVEQVRVEHANGTRGVVKTVTDRGTIAIWRDRNDGRYLVSLARGSYVERTQTGAAVSAPHRMPIDGRSEFDALGYAKTGASDPAELIPIFPGKKVGVGDRWSVTSRVSSTYGSGVARYEYRVVRLARNANGHLLATFTVAMQAALKKPGMRIPDAQAAASGTITWDCTEHERAFSDTVVAYTTQRRGETIVDAQTESDRFVQTR